MPARTRRNGYRGEPSRSRFAPLAPKQRLCLHKLASGLYCLEPRFHRGKHKSFKGDPE